MAIATSTSSRKLYRYVTLLTLITIMTAASVRLKADTGTCAGQMITLLFTDVPASSVFFCSTIDRDCLSGARLGAGWREFVHNQLVAL